MAGLVPMNPTTAANYGAFVNAAYIMYGAQPNSVTPTPKAIPSGYQVIDWIQMSDFVGNVTTVEFYGFIARNSNPPNEYVVAIRGTETATEWLDNFDFGFEPFSEVAGCGDVARGFNTIYQTIRVVSANVRMPSPSIQQSSLAGDIARVATGSTGGVDGTSIAAAAPIVVVGHSLGSALASLYVLENEKKNLLQNVTIYTFASPRVGDATFAASFNGLRATSWRIDNGPDVVPDLPPDAFGYVHVNTAYAINSSGKVQGNLSCAHSLLTYLNLLDSATFSVDPACAP